MPKPTEALNSSSAACLSKPIRAYLALGSNLGDSRRLMKRALEGIEVLPHTLVVGRSSLYRSPAWGVTESQPDYINAVVAIDTEMPPNAILHALQGIEAAIGRTRSLHRNEARFIDVDLLLYGELVLNTTELEIPHPRMTERAFVLHPLAEIDNTTSVPGQGEVSELMRKLPAQVIERIEATAPPREWV